MASDHNPAVVPAEHGDAEAVAEVYADSWPRSVTHAATGEVREDLLRMRGADFWRGEISRRQSHRGQFLVARVGARVIGFGGSASEPDGGWELLWLFVRPRFHGRGAGELLHDEMIAGSLRARASRRFLWAVPGNIRAERFYSDRGWRPTAAVKDVETPSGTFPLRKWILPI